MSAMIIDVTAILAVIFLTIEAIDLVIKNYILERDYEKNDACWERTISNCVTNHKSDLKEFSAEINRLRAIIKEIAPHKLQKRDEKGRYR